MTVQTVRLTRIEAAVLVIEEPGSVVVVAKHAADGPFLGDYTAARGPTAADALMLILEGRGCRPGELPAVKPAPTVPPTTGAPLEILLPEPVRLSETPAPPLPHTRRRK